LITHKLQLKGEFSLVMYFNALALPCWGGLGGENLNQVFCKGEPLLISPHPTLSAIAPALLYLPTCGHPFGEGLNQQPSPINMAEAYT
ncbi:MAG: hypothetical protein QM500_15470, partial [Methylococcales bacterium]